MCIGGGMVAARTLVRSALCTGISFLIIPHRPILIFRGLGFTGAPASLPPADMGANARGHASLTWERDICSTPGGRKKSSVGVDPVNWFRGREHSCLYPGVLQLAPRLAW